MKTGKRFRLSAAAFAGLISALAAAPFAVADAEEDASSYAADEFDYSVPSSSAFLLEDKAAFGLEVFWADAESELLDFYGVRARYVCAQEALASSGGLASKISPEFFFGCAVGYGDNSTESSYYDSFEQLRVSATAGANLRFRIDDVFSVYVGAQIGADFFYLYSEGRRLSYDSWDYYYTHEEKDAVDVGVFYGIGIGADIRFSEDFALTLGVEQMTSTAGPETCAGSELEHQDYTVFSVGAKIIF